ncbi:phytoene desaturase family protein [Anaeromyxobacter oryzae]|uniref:Phytoene dehydrogenase n=1 Tax=Anaeromyxobacter oryzae TaxID=2918170 RepID=A0ABN6MPA8_9BACT|nr:NAD(P)/FAD-dependent oxidoreductase [Anaeromyxobacter oryzae]BDG02221.1 phytoene dehydrogenase [Anaeromyxobacter oryzae]
MTGVGGDGRVDALVIGAGISGLVAATDLAARGHRVLVVEHDHQAGGLMAGMRRRGFHFDVGCQSFEDMGIVFPLLDAYGLSDLATFRRARYRLAMPGLDVDVESIPQVRAAFQRAFPDSAAAFGRVFDLHARTSELIRALFVPERIPHVVDGGGASLARWVLGALGGSSPAALVRRVRDLRTWMLEDFERWYARELPPSSARDLLSRCGYTGMNVFVASAFWHLWADDYWYPEGGLQAFFERWVARLEARGVRFMFKRTVTALEVRGGRVEAAVTHHGERLAADEVVYTGDPRQALRLVGRERFPPARAARLERTRHSDALVSVYLGLDLAPEALRERLRTAHVFYFPDPGCRTALDADAGAHRKAFLEVTAHGLFDPTLAPPGKTAVVLQAFTRHDWQDGWGTGLTGDTAREERGTPRPPAYRALKRRVADDLLATFERLVPGASSRVEFLDVGAPPSTVRFTRNAFGGSCGFALDWRNFPFALPLGNAATPLANLHAAGHFTVWPGAVPTAALSGKIAARRADARLRARRPRPRPVAPAPGGAAEDLAAEPGRGAA